MKYLLIIVLCGLLSSCFGDDYTSRRVRFIHTNIVEVMQVNALAREGDTLQLGAGVRVVVIK